jgi:lipopolysaccharide/colanic/teichoic acid biosynthesis glycosyltransferase
MDAREKPVSGALWSRGPKRLFDGAAALILLLVLSPLLVLIAALVKLTSRGAVFFTQDRAGKDARIFRLVKFRTMRGDRKPDPKELVPLHHPDITALGYVLRRFKIDEVPQLFNVIRGEMSLVGPRPTLPDQVAAYDAFRRQRLLVRPGITGLAQVYGNSLMPWDERILYDIAYVRRCGFFLDLSILLRTILVVFVGERRMTRRFTNSPFARYVDPPEAEN